MKQRKDHPEDIKKRIAADREDFNLKNIEGLDLIIDTNDINLSQVADMIYINYLDILEKKKLRGKQLSLF
jgi:hypothetical protein